MLQRGQLTSRIALGLQPVAVDLQRLRDVVGFDDAADPDLDLLFAVNAIGPIRLVRAATPALVASAAEGREPFVVTLSGIVSELPTAGIAAYSASKSALAAFAKASARGLKRTGVRLIDARPGHTETGLASRPIFGTAPKFPAGLTPETVVDRIVVAIASSENDLPSTAFTA
ncbi:MAG: SDR family NAD(P)-dependent oxidoreductase [Actinobacteria bacterium]|nr:SDR family NAD(P)-dependent oxidoreductase [Actinomycetota bacterium]